MTVKKQHTGLIQAGLDLLFPPSCPCCRKQIKSGVPLCPDCFAQLRFIKAPFCSCCGKEFISGSNHLCGECLTSHPAFDKIRAPFAYEKVIADLIHHLKYSGDMTGLTAIHWLVKKSQIPDDLDQPDIIIPVPLHIKRLRKRGFNQALLLAEILFPEQKKQIRTDIITRKINTLPQMGLNGKERRKNLKNVFVIATPKGLKNKSILLLDDVFTTGTTVQECARTLKQAGCRRVEVMTICRADRHLF